MATNNAANFNNPLSVANGGTSVTTLTQSGVLFGNGTTNISATAQGTSGQIIAGAGSSTNPFWRTVINQKFLASSTISGGIILFSNSLDFTKYQHYLLTYNNLFVLSDILLIQFSTNNGSTYITSGYNGGALKYATTSTTGSQIAASTTYQPISGGNVASGGAGGYIYMHYSSQGSGTMMMNGEVTSFAGGSTTEFAFIAGNCTSVSSANSFKIAGTANNISSGTARFYALES